MNALEDALAAATYAEAFRHLVACDRDHHGELEQAATRELEALRSEPRIGNPREAGYHEQQHRFWVVTAALLVTAGAEGPTKADGWRLLSVFREEAVADYLSSNPPAWFEDSLEHGLAHLSVSVQGDRWFDLHHPYVIRGSIPRPAADDLYHRFLLIACHDRPEFAEDRVKEHLRSYPEIVEIELPHALRALTEKNNFGYLIKEDFEWWDGGRKFEPGEEHTLSVRPVSTGRHLPTPLAIALRELADAGEIDRTTLLRHTLEAIGDAPNEPATRQLRRWHDFFIGSPAEAAGIVDTYESLLSSPFPPVVKFAVEHIDSMFPHLDRDALTELLLSSQVALSHTKSKPLILATIALLRRVVEREPEFYVEVAEQLVEVLEVPAANLQKAVLGVLELGQGEARAEIAALLPRYRSQIAGSLRKAFEPWFEASAHTTSSPAAEAADDDSPAATAPPPTSEPAAVPRGEPVKPLRSIDDLVFTANTLLAKSPDPLQFELLMDGLAALPASDRPALAKGLKPLQKRALKKFDQKNSWDLPCWIERLAGELVVRFGAEPEAAGRWWINLVETSDEKGPDSYDKPAPGAIRFLIRRLLELLDPERPVGPLLGTPETDLGFIPFATLLERVRSRLDAGHAIAHCDFLQGIARCDAASGAGNSAGASDPDPEPLRVLHFLATGEIVGSVETAVWWITAGRIRDPQHDYSEVPELKAFVSESEAWPDWLQPARHRKIERPEHGYFQWLPDLLDQPRWRSDTPPSDAVLSLRFGDTFLSESCTTNCDADLRWLFSVAPGHLDPVLGQMLAITRSATELTPAPLKTGIPVIFDELSRRHPPLGTAMRYHLLYNLSADLKPCREATPELWLQAELDGRLAPAIPALADDFRQALHSFDWADPEAYVPLSVFDLSRVNPGLDAIKNLHPNLPLRLRDLLLAAFSPGLEFSPRALSKTLDLLLALVIDHPLAQPVDLKPLLESPLAKKDLAAARKLAKAVGG